ANALATYEALAENSLLEKTRDRQTFMHWYCQQMGKTEHTQVDLEGQAYEVVKAFYPDVVHLQFQMKECHKMFTDQIDWLIQKVIKSGLISANLCLSVVHQVMSVFKFNSFSITTWIIYDMATRSAPMTSVPLTVYLIGGLIVRNSTLTDTLLTQAARLIRIWQGARNLYMPLNGDSRPEGSFETWNALLVVEYEILTTDTFRELNEHIISAFRVDYGETFSPVEDIRAIRILLPIAPEGFVDLKHPNKVCNLQCCIYGSRIWNKRCDEEIKKISFTQIPDEPCVYLKASGSNVVFLVLELAYILGVKIIHDRSKRLIALSQSAYLEKILKKFRMENSKKGYTPMMKNPNYRKSQGAKTPTEVQHMQRIPYTSAVDSIMYVVRCTRLEVSFAQNLYSHFQQNPGEIHWTAMKNILKYLRNTKDMVLMYGEKPKDELKVSCYADASFNLTRTIQNLKRDMCSYLMVEP
nr:hypothetical protein [Tanacetum cinerariifolium]